MLVPGLEFLTIMVDLGLAYFTIMLASHLSPSLSLMLMTLNITLILHHH